MSNNCDGASATPCRPDCSGYCFAGAPYSNRNPRMDPRTLYSPVFTRHIWFRLLQSMFPRVTGCVRFATEGDVRHAPKRHDDVTIRVLLLLLLLLLLCVFRCCTLLLLSREKLVRSNVAAVL